MVKIPTFIEHAQHSGLATSNLHDCHTLSVDGAKVGVVEESNKVRLSGFLKGKKRSTLETEIIFEVLGNLTNKTLERSLTDQKFHRLLILADLTESNRSRAVAMRLLDTSGGGRGFAGSLGCEEPFLLLICVLFAWYEPF